MLHHRYQNMSEHKCVCCYSRAKALQMPSNLLENCFRALPTITDCTKSSIALNWNCQSLHHHRQETRRWWHDWRSWNVLRWKTIWSFNTITRWKINWWCHCLQEDRDYKRMTQNVDAQQYFGKKNTMHEFGKEVKSMNRQLVAVLNTGSQLLISANTVCF